MLNSQLFKNYKYLFQWLKVEKKRNKENDMNILVNHQQDRIGPNILYNYKNSLECKHTERMANNIWTCQKS